ncbi:hypothetical protein B0T14DRAFT_147535 [Immersiella caudata]|uniref:Uncharacterized protein n=1 Tax=Immersiella caudata TaxID=314043 RepID=A0AA39WVE6_9PEZI|nr:hypothetical protein B0T14DRAFT_147535 [Immersiella caudata]
MLRHNSPRQTAPSVFALQLQSQTTAAHQPTQRAGCRAPSSMVLAGQRRRNGAESLDCDARVRPFNWQNWRLGLTHNGSALTLQTMGGGAGAFPRGGTPSALFALDTLAVAVQLPTSQQHTTTAPLQIGIVHRVVELHPRYIFEVLKGGWQHGFSIFSYSQLTVLAEASQQSQPPRGDAFRRRHRMLPASPTSVPGTISRNLYSPSGSLSAHLVHEIHGCIAESNVSSPGWSDAEPTSHAHR